MSQLLDFLCNSTVARPATVGATGELRYPSPMHVTRDVELPVTVDEAWQLLTDPDELGAWLGDLAAGEEILEQAA